MIFSSYLSLSLGISVHPIYTPCRVIQVLLYPLIRPPIHHWEGSYSLSICSLSTVHYQIYLLLLSLILSHHHSVMSSTLILSIINWTSSGHGNHMNASYDSLIPILLLITLIAFLQFVFVIEELLISTFLMLFCRYCCLHLGWILGNWMESLPLSKISLRILIKS